ncbi:MAG: BMP family ABC transporter substrate-binding protein [Oscillospiraceae bacterium]|nr:BMP family ABC transporter substrate-binding protein [Oscillospiraceae bacterium]
MADTTYQQAHKLGLKEMKARMAKHEDPYLPSLEEEISHLSGLAEEELGSIRVDLDQVVGTRSTARREAFSPSFYPLLDDSSEFAAKWAALAQSHLKDGIRDAIVAVEYLNRFYVVEGHKRVSVLRYFGASTVQAEVKRLLPPRSEEPEIVVYYEFLDFYKITRINYIRFSRLGSYPAMRKLLCGEETAAWDEDRRRGFYADVVRFRKAYAGSALSGSLTQDEALLRYLEIFGAESLSSRSPAELKADLAVIAPELKSVENESEPVLVTDPAAAQPRSIISRIVHPSVKQLRAAFLHDKNPESSYWTYAHEQGRLAAQEALGERVETQSVFNMLEQDFDSVMKELADKGVDMVFSTTPRLLKNTLSAAAALPNVKFLNCSLNVSHPILRCYYPRMYEAKFLTGVIAGALSDKHSIGYICDYPIYSMPASINAFALGVRMVNPRARVLLQWSTVQGADIERLFADYGVTAVSGQDSLIRDERRDKTGIFLWQGEQQINVGSSFWDWGTFYRKILESVADGSWNELKSTSDAGQTINYWWGLSSGVVDVRLSEKVPAETARLVRLLRESIMAGTFRPFDGPIYDQKGELRIAEGELLNPHQILVMDWLVENVDGEIPKIEQLTPPAQELVKIQGVLKDEGEKAQ